MRPPDTTSTIDDARQAVAASSGYELFIDCAQDILSVTATVDVQNGSPDLSQAADGHAAQQHQLVVPKVRTAKSFSSIGARSMAPLPTARYGEAVTCSSRRP
jgi:hypothetical protein